MIYQRERRIRNSYNFQFIFEELDITFGQNLLAFDLIINRRDLISEIRKQMKFHEQMQNMKNQINDKIKTHNKSERDYIVFRPKGFAFNPILNRNNHNLTSIFQLQNKRKNQEYFLSIRSKTKQLYQKSIQVQDHLRIQRCKTFKKIRTHKQLNHKILRPFNTSTPRERLNLSVVSIKNLQSSKSKRKVSANLSSPKQEKRTQKLAFKTKINLSSKQKQNFLKDMKPIFLRSPSRNVSFKTDFLFNLKDPQKERILLLRRVRESHKKFQTQISSIQLLKMTLQKHKQTTSKSGLNRADQTIVFKPWETMQGPEKQEQFQNY